MNAEPPSFTDEAILVIEDDKNIAELLTLHLSDIGYDVTIVSSGEKGLEEALTGTYSLIILDLMLPDLDGFEVCRQIREKEHSLPILILTAKSEEVDKVMGLELGADDYITKPFSIRELIARVKAIFRRIEMDQQEHEQLHTPEEIQYGDLKIEPAKRKVTRDGASLELTAKEFDLLVLLAQHPGRAYNRQELLDQVWGYQHGGYSHTVNTHINRLRKKIEEDPSEPRYVKTVWGVGYRFVEPEELSS